MEVEMFSGLEKAIALGVAAPEKLPVMAKVIADRGGEGFAFRGDDGIDELTIGDTSTIIQINDGAMTALTFDPQDLGIERAPLAALVGGTPEENAVIIKEIFRGKTGPIREAILLNAAIAIAAFKGDFSIGVTQQIANGYVMAAQAVDSGKALELLENWAQYTQELSAAQTQG
jgi:anthranilate phosphoribosyltransferase